MAERVEGDGIPKKAVTRAAPRATLTTSGLASRGMQMARTRFKSLKLHKADSTVLMPIVSVAAVFLLEAYCS
jgi:hypothetical protein